MRSRIILADLSPRSSAVCSLWQRCSKAAWAEVKEEEKSKEKWYGVEYGMRDGRDIMKDLVTSADSEGLHLPVPNAYIPER